MSYQEGKEAARQKAIDWQLSESDHPYSQGGLNIICEYFHKIGKRFGLLREFRNNGIPC